MGLFGKSKKEKAVQSAKKLERAAKAAAAASTDEISAITGPSQVPSPTNDADKGRNNQVDSTRADPLLIQKEDSSDDELMVIDHGTSSMMDKVASGDPTLEGKDSDYEIVNKTNSYSTLGEKSDVVNPEMAYSVMKVGPLSNPEPMVNGQLVQWKFTAEEGPWPLRLISVTAAIGVAVTSILPFCLQQLNVSVGNIIMSLLTFFGSIVVIFLDGRFSLVRNPLGCRATIRTTIVKSVNSLKLVWGRGVLYIVIGLLQIAQMTLMTYVSGGVMILVGVIALIIGGSASNNLARLRSALTDEDYLWYEFNRHDYDQDGYLTPSDFANYVWAIGLEFDDVYTLKAFNAIDQDRNLKISYADFQVWWSQCTDAEDMTYTREQEMIRQQPQSSPPKKIRKESLKSSKAKGQEQA